MLIIFIISIFMLIVSIGDVKAVDKKIETLDSFIKKVLKNYETLTLAKLNIISTKSEIQIIESSLGWNLFANAGVDRSRTFIGAESTQSSLLFGVNKVFQSGGSIELKSSYLHDDSNFTINNNIANPISTTGIDLNYRIPLMQNKNKNEYQLNIDSVNSGYLESINAQSIISDQVTAQAIDLYYAVAILVARLDTAKQSIKRSIKLKEHIKKNIKLGILEKGEISQAEAQLYNLQGQYEELILIWDKSKISINRLIGMPWNNSFSTIVSDSPVVKYELDEIREIVKKYNPELKILNLNLKLADSIIALNRDSTKSKLDIIFSVGALKTQGPSSTGDINDSDVIGGVRVEYQKAIDSRGLDSKLYQSQVNKESVQIKITKLELDLKYDIYTLVSDINHLTKINRSYRKRFISEQSKFTDIVNRYRAGRAETNLVIQFENELTQAELIYKTQKILREKTISLLKLKQGKLNFNKVENQ